MLEAAQAGCALVLGDIPSLRELWGDAAWFVAPGDADGLRYALLRLIGDEPLRHALSRQARRRAERYTPCAMATQYREAYVELLERRSAPENRNHAVVAGAGVHP